MWENVKNIVQGNAVAYGVDYEIECVGDATKLERCPDMIEAFFKALNYLKNSIGSFRFQGECEAFILLSDVSAAKVNRFERNVESIY